MKAFFIASLVVLIASAASAQTSELAPIVKSGNSSARENSQQEVINQDEPEIAVLPLGTPNAAEAPPVAAPPAAPSPEVKRPAVKSSTRLQVEANASRPIGPRFICRGTEPFWVLRIEQQGISFDKAGEPQALYSQPDAAPSENSALAVTNFVSKNEKNESISAVVVDTQLSGGVRCTDGMNDQLYTHTVYIVRGVQVFDGCCWMER